MARGCPNRAALASGARDPIFGVMRFFGSSWAIALRGVAAILFGFLALRLPFEALLALTILFGAFAIVDGILSIVAAVRAGREHQPVGPLAVEGLLGLVAGILALVWPGIGALSLLILIAVWAMVVGCWKMAIAISLRKEIDHAWLLGISGVLAFLFGLAVIVYPTSGAIAVTAVIGVFALMQGMLLLGVALRFHRFERHPPPVAVS
jgi:uncharacterized membrane protein HdeD (DUF308 family)